MTSSSGSSRCANIARSHSQHAQDSFCTSAHASLLRFCSQTRACGQVCLLQLVAIGRGPRSERFSLATPWILGPVLRIATNFALLVCTRKARARLPIKNARARRQFASFGRCSSKIRQKNATVNDSAVYGLAPKSWSVI